MPKFSKPTFTKPTFAKPTFTKPSSGAAAVGAKKNTKNKTKKMTKTKKTVVPSTKPKAAVSAYFHFVALNRPSIAAANPGSSLTDVAKLLGTAWAAVQNQSAARMHFDKLAADDKARYATEMAAWKPSPAELFMHAQKKAKAAERRAKKSGGARKKKKEKKKKKGGDTKAKKIGKAATPAPITAAEARTLKKKAIARHKAEAEAAMEGNTAGVEAEKLSASSKMFRRLASLKTRIRTSVTTTTKSGRECTTVKTGTIIGWWGASDIGGADWLDIEFDGSTFVEQVELFAKDEGTVWTITAFGVAMSEIESGLDSSDEE